MSNFVSIFDVMETGASLTPIKDEILSMKLALKSEMDKGMSMDEMQEARKKETAIISAEEILEKA